MKCGGCSPEELAWRMWDQYNCEEMQENWQVCTNDADPNHDTVMANCPTTCAAARVTTTTTTVAAYYTAPGAENCPDGLMVDTAAECATAGPELGYPYRMAVTNLDERPAGCFWDTGGGSYFNTALSASATWGGVGAICKNAITTTLVPSAP